jgi:hypothetical protein
MIQQTRREQAAQRLVRLTARAPADFTEEMRSAACYFFAGWHRSQSKSKSGQHDRGRGRVSATSDNPKRVWTVSIDSELNFTDILRQSST